MSKRRQARELALQMLYQQELGQATRDEVLSHFRTRAGGSPGAGHETGATPASGFGYAAELFGGVLDHRERIDALIGEQADNWRVERMPPVDRNILRLAVYEMLYQTDVPKLVILDEAIELAKRFGAENSGRFVNGLLDGLLKTRAFPGSLT